MSKNSASNKQIAKNTIFLFVRMLLVMGISIYTSRIILGTLGVEDYGLYTVIAGVVVLFSFLDSALNNSSQRYLSIAAGEGDNRKIETVFSTSFMLHFGLAIFIGLLTELVGLYLLKHHLNIPPNNYSVALVTFHIVVITTMVNVVNVPFNAVIIANEKMGFYAYASIVETTLKLLIVYSLSFFDSNKLILYSLLLLGIHITMLTWRMLYVFTKFKGYRIRMKYNAALFKEMTAFTGWNLFGGIADVGYKYGTNIILNIFYGVTLNATMGISNQVRAAIFSFAVNLQTAAYPQITKRCHQNDDEGFRSLVLRISKYAFLLIAMIGLPILLNINYILDIWLVNPPPYSDLFCFYIIIFCLVDSLHGPLWVAIQASGKIRMTQIAVSIVLLLNLPLTYLAFTAEYAPIYMLYIQIAVCLLTLIVRIYYLQKATTIRFPNYVQRVLKPIFIVCLLALPLPIYLAQKLSGFTGLATSFITCSIGIMLATYLFALDENEKKILKAQICRLTKKHNETTE